jgi:hypothetical protein
MRERCAKEEGLTRLNAVESGGQRGACLTTFHK